jgi:hypothetical protein
VARPTLALHAAIEFRFNPASPVRTRRHGLQPLLGSQQFFQFDGLGSGRAACELADVARRGCARLPLWRILRSFLSSPAIACEVCHPGLESRPSSGVPLGRAQPLDHLGVAVVEEGALAGVERGDQRYVLIGELEVWEP